MAKRLVDIVLSAALLLIALPALLPAALMILITSPGPVIFRQQRMGRGFQLFEILKLRTMNSTKSGSRYTLGQDPRITRVGRLLRRTKLDEFPQLWNVLRGEMSLVGPRPVLPELTDEFHEYYTFLLRARPGLTDPASLKYSQETRLLERVPNPMQFFKTVVTPDKVRMSLEYMTHANLWTDCVVLAHTAAICCFPALSRIYGELPAIAGKPEPRLLFENAAPTRPVTDRGIFAYDLAYQEAAAEEMSQIGILPWIPLQNPVLRARHTSTGAPGSVSRL